MTSSDSDTQPRRKRVRTSKGAGSDDSRKRGRPRVESQAESAVDRRRTQIRVAQRAYRQRKESKLEHLRKRVSDLQGVIESMNTSFSRLTELSQTEHVGPNLRLQMQEMSRQFADMASRSLIDEDGSMDVREDEQRHSGSVGSADERVSEHGDVSAARDAPLLTSQGAGDATNVPTANQTPIHPGIAYPAFSTQTVMDDDMEETPTISPQSVARPAAINDMAVTPYRGNSPLRMRSPTVPGLDIRVTLAAPYTYSYQETTFARQLHRACIERGHKLLSDANRNRKTYEYCIGLTLSHSTHERLLSWFEKMLRKTTHESLDNWATPLLHIGGAGRHYPRFDEFGQVMSLPSSSNLRSIGPQKVASAHAFGKQANSDVPSTPDMLVDLAGYEGEWFDPYDVEGYLAEKGIRIGPRASFAEADMTYAPSSRDTFSDTAASNTSATLSATSVSNPQTPYEIGHESFATESTAFAANAATTASDMLPESGHVLFGADPGFSNVGYSDVYTGGYANYLPGSTSRYRHLPLPPVDSMQSEMDTMNVLVRDSAQQRLAERRRRVTFDVAKIVNKFSRFTDELPVFLLAALTISAVCLGRTPGFRKKDVDRAIRNAVVHAY
ncbi:hypothetical protein LTR66_013361 [Elasticomyces elasticus]|nr:hypothetical protein LTR66_013361 [Elasticomyces elasticus]